MVKIGHFLWKWSKLGHFGDRNDDVGQNFVMGQTKCFFELSQKSFQSGLLTYFWSHVIYGVNLVGIGHFVGQNWVISGNFVWPKWHHRSKFCDGTKIIFLYTVFRIISVWFIDISLVTHVINGGKFGQNRYKKNW